MIWPFYALIISISTYILIFPLFRLSSIYLGYIDKMNVEFCNSIMDIQF